MPPDKGLYVERRLLGDQLLRDFYALDGYALDKDLHVTIAFSREVFPFKPDTTDVRALVTHAGVLGADNALVLYLDSPELRARWAEFRAAGATWDFETYEPHITLMYLGPDFENLPDGLDHVKLPDFPLLFGPERGADLDLSRSSVGKYNANHMPAGSSKGGQFAPRAGTGYSFRNGAWRKANGTEASDAHVKRLTEIGASRGYKDIRLNPDHEAYLRAVATDAKGRRKGFYSAEYVDAQKQAKFKRNEAFHAVRPHILDEISSTLRQHTGADPRMWEAAFVLRLIDRTAFRPGSDKNTKAEKKAFGATTLLVKHVKVVGDKITFNFVGKKGVKQSKTLTDGLIAHELKARIAERGPNERLFGVNGSDLKNFLVYAGHGRFMPKDFRTWNGTSRAMEVIKKMPVPRTPQEYKAAVKHVSTVVAAHLGNTPAMAFNSYINPRVWHKWPPPLKRAA